MRKLTLTLLASAALAMPAMVPAMAQTSSPTQEPQMQHQSSATEQQQAQQPNQQQAQQNNQQNSQNQANQNNGQQNPEQAANQPVPPRELGRSGVKQIQQALDKSGFHAGRADGIDGPKTRTALKDFQKSKGIQSTGKINQQTLSDLGVKMASNQRMANQANMNNHQNGNAAANQNRQ